MDVVVLGYADCDSAKIHIAARYIHKFSPWVRRIFWVTEKNDNSLAEELIPGVQVIHVAELRKEVTFDIPIGAGALPEEALLHNIPQLSEHFFVLRKNSYLSQSLRALDLFTPNGIPLLFLTMPETASQPLGQIEQVTCTRLKEQGAAIEPRIYPVPGIYAQSKENSKQFLPVFSKLNTNKYSRKSSPADFTLNLPSLDYHVTLSHWTYASGHAVPKVLAHPLTRYAED